MAALEEKIADLDTQIAASATNYGKLNQLMEEKTEAEAKLEEKMERWMYLNDLEGFTQEAESADRGFIPDF